MYDFRIYCRRCQEIDKSELLPIHCSYLEGLGNNPTFNPLKSNTIVPCPRIGCDLPATIHYFPKVKPANLQSTLMASTLRIWKKADAVGFPGNGLTTTTLLMDELATEAYLKADIPAEEGYCRMNTIPEYFV